ncbi:MAG: fibronectin type III domain-containing protein, partial [Clostridiales bacterium]|nr:fibronectin type III domain-containing protein [Clostridiales bacterium]
GHTAVLFPLNARGDTTFTLAYHSNVSSALESQLARSQVIVWTPDDIPPISIPSNFRIIKDGSQRHYSLTPQFPPYQWFNHPDVNDDERANWDTWGQYVGDLNFWAEWDIGTIEDIAELVDISADGSITVNYTMALARAPDTNDSSYGDYLNVTARIFRDPANPVTGVMMVEYSAGFVNRPNVGGNPIVNSAPQVLRYRLNQLTGDTINYVSINILTDAVHLYRPISPPPPFVRDDFRFPNVYFMNARLISWNYITGYDPVTGDPIRSGSDPTGFGVPSLFDYIVIDDISELQPPAPANVSASADRRPETAPSITVGYNIPLEALRTYFRTGSPVASMVTVNIYISQYEDAAMNAFFNDGVSLDPDSRIMRGDNPNPPFNSQVYEYDWTQSPAPDDPAAFGEVDMSDPSVRRVLRGENPDVPTGVVRISNIPVLRNMATQTSPLGTPINARLDAPQAELQAAMRAWDEILNPGTTNPPSSYTQLVNLTNLDENKQYYIFADLVVHRFVSESALSVTGNPNVLVPYPGVRDVHSGLSNVSADTTVGTPNVIDPGLVGPPAPENLRAPSALRGQTAATLLWNPIFPALGEEQNVRIEWEIIRIRDGVRMTDTQMYSRNDNLAAFFANEIDSVEKAAWMTGTEADGSRYLIEVPGSDKITMPDAEERYEFDFDHLTDISFRDLTLSPNQLYYYYVRTVRIVRQTNEQLGIVESRSVSNWVEVPVTTYPVSPPINLKLEDGQALRPGMDVFTQVLVSWEHDDMARILDAMGTDFEFQYRIREAEGQWREITTVSHQQMTAANLDPQNSHRIRFLLSGLDPGVPYEMQVRLRDINADDYSLWSNAINFVTDFDPDDLELERDVGNWLEYIRRQLNELLLRPYWFAQNTPTSGIMVIRPDDIFAGMMLDNPGALPLPNTDTNNNVIYIPATVINTANENRRSFSTRFSDLEILFAPGFINRDHNQAVMDMIRAVEARGSDLTDFFIRLEIGRTPMSALFDVPAITRQTNVSVSLVATNDKIRSISSWDRSVANRARAIVENTVSDPVMSQNIRNLLRDNTTREEMVEYSNIVVRNVSNQITQMVSDDLRTTGTTGMLSNTTQVVREFNAAMHLVVTTATPETSVNAFRHQNGQWIPQTTSEYNSGRAISSGSPGTFAFTGRTVSIPGIEEVPRGSTVTSIVARFGLEDLFGPNVDLQRNATRQMVIGSAARIAGAPHGSDPMTWAAANLNVNMSSRNATGLISRQEAIAVVMSVYERRTNTNVNTIQIRNFQTTAGLQLDQRYAQAVRAAHEVGILSDANYDPAGAITIGEFLNMLAELTTRVPF